MPLPVMVAPEPQVFEFTHGTGRGLLYDQGVSPSLVAIDPRRTLLICLRSQNRHFFDATAAGFAWGGRLSGGTGGRGRGEGHNTSLFVFVPLRMFFFCQGALSVYCLDVAANGSCQSVFVLVGSCQKVFLLVECLTYAVL